MNKVVAILLLAGDSLRFSSPKSKIFYQVNGKSLFLFPLLSLSSNSNITEIILVCKKEAEEEIRNIVSSYKINQEIKYVEGGSSRSESVLNALNSISDFSANDIVVICDGDRPNLTQSLLEENIKTAKEFDGCVTAVKTIDTIFSFDNTISYLDRSKLWNAQTPQSFKIHVIKDAYKDLNEKINTDDASICVAKGYNIKVVEGSYNNYKITTTEDIKKFISEQNNG